VLLGGGLFLADRPLAGNAAPELSGNPIPADQTSLARGQARYQQHCGVCQGETGVGDGPAGASLVPPPADLTLHARWPRTSSSSALSPTA